MPMRRQNPILMGNEKKLHELADYLLEKETITGEEFMEILNESRSRWYGGNCLGD